MASQPHLVRVIGRWSLTALVFNSILGSGIFGLPSVILGLTGSASVVAYLVAAAGVAIIMACFAEVASRFTEPGGVYLYAREAFGRLIGIQMGWLAWLVRITAASTNASLFVIYLGEFWPAAARPLPRMAVLGALIGMLALINYRGVSAGARTSNMVAIAKLLPLTVFILFGAWYVATHHAAPALSIIPSDRGNWTEAILLLVFAFSGYESALSPMGEARDPRRDAPIALFTALGVLTLFYVAIHVIVMAVLPTAAETSRPLADAARIFLGSAGAAMISLGAMLSVYGYLAANMLNVPRLTFALAERGDFPAPFAALSSRFNTPYFSILIFAGVVWGLAAWGGFRWNLMLTSVARLFTYGIVCSAVIVFQRRDPKGAWFRLPAGALLPVLGVLFSVLLLTRMGRTEVIIIAITAALALLNWWWASRHAQNPSS